MNPCSQRCRVALLLLIVAVVSISASSAGAANTVLKFETDAGDVYTRMLYGDTHDTIANFLNYVNNGIYNQSIFHRLVPGFVLQGGGFAFDSSFGPYPVTKYADIEDDYGHPNVRSTLAMAKSSDTDSANSGFYFNLDDANAAMLGPHEDNPETP